jgi:diguanylate cyclase (GGDEF)-like protein
MADQPPEGLLVPRKRGGAGWGGEIANVGALALLSALLAWLIAMRQPASPWLTATPRWPDWSVLAIGVPFALAGALTTFLALRQHLTALERALSRAEDRARRDPLTRLYNQGNVKPILEARLRDIVAGKQTFSVILLDLDDFKRVNQDFGHDGGSRVLVQVADLLSAFASADGDFICRFGGDEFLILTKQRSSDLDPTSRDNSALDEGYGFAELLRRAIETREFILDDSGLRRATITVSCGATTMVPGDTPETLLGRVSRALGCAKAPRQGGGGVQLEKNVVSFLPSSPVGP